MDTIKQIEIAKEFLNTHYKTELEKKPKFVEVDFRKLMKHDPELADLLLEEFEETSKAIEIAWMDLTDKRKIQVLYTDLPDESELPLSEISNQLGKFLSFRGSIIKPSEIFLKCKIGKYECPSCGNNISVHMLGREWREPTRCGCGRKGKFKLLSKELIKFQRFELVEVLDKIPDRPKRLAKKSVFVGDNLTRKDLNDRLQLGQLVMVHGFLEEEEIRIRGMKSASNEFKTNIIANNWIPIETSWDALKLTKSMKDKAKEMAQRADLLDEFAQSLAPSFEGYEVVRKSLILQHVGGKRIKDHDGGLEERGTIHVLLTGGPGTGKTYIMKKSVRISPLWNWTTGKGMTKVGLVACVVRDEYGGFTLEVGPLVMADKGILGIDELEKIEKTDFGMLNNAMADEQTKITKATIDQTLMTRTALLATSNPTHKTFNDSTAIINQFAPIPKDILDRFDVVWAMREKIDQDKLESKYMARHKQDSGRIKQIWSTLQMREYIAYARRLNPILTDNAVIKHFNEKFRKLTGKTVDEDGEEKSSHRLRGNIMRWAYAYTKFHGIGKENADGDIPVSKNAVDFAFSIMRHSFGLLDLISKEGFVNYEDMEEIPKTKEVNKYYLIRDVLKELSTKFKNVVPEEEIVREVFNKNKEIDKDMVYTELEKLSKNGEVFQPKRGVWGLL
ncbi:MAG: minichromosome maintenance protein MCM [bacterium]|nr:minichromosome maintenance protein MCM [bacterium]